MHQNFSYSKICWDETSLGANSVTFYLQIRMRMFTYSIQVGIKPKAMSRRLKVADIRDLRFQTQIRR